jgi:cation diffusion facilitator CzcD-associated flavoprotein CzcO
MPDNELGLCLSFTGAGHSGLMTAARLNMIGISNLIIDRQKRSGDVWRTRYHKLVLHDPCWMNAMPYLAYPSNWPIYASKDKQADFLEVCRLSVVSNAISNSDNSIMSPL